MIGIKVKRAIAGLLLSAFMVASSSVIAIADDTESPDSTTPESLQTTSTDSTSSDSVVETDMQESSSDISQTDESLISSDESITLTLSVLTDDDLFRVVGESGASTINIVIKDKGYSVVKETNVNVTNGRFDWSETLSKYTASDTYKVYVTDNYGNSISETVAIPEKEDSYTLNLTAMSGSRYLTVAGESSFTSVSITIKSNTYVTVVSTTATVTNGRFEWNDAISKYKRGSSYYVTVKDPDGHTASETVAIPEKVVTEDDYTLTLLITTKDGKLKIAGESSENKVKIVIKNDSLSEVDRKTIEIKSGKYSWSQSLSEFDEDRVYKVIVTDNKDHTTSQEVTIPISAASIEFGEYEKKLEIDKTMSLSVTVLPSGAQNQIVTYESSDNRIATVSANGKVLGKNPGKVTITASIGDISESIELTVYIKTVAIELNENYLVLLPNETFQIYVDVIPKTASVEYKFTSTNERVVTVTDKGFVTAINKGVASVIVTNGNADGILTVVVNGSGDGMLGSWVRKGVSYIAEEHLESSALADVISQNETKEVVLSNPDLDVVDSAALLKLKNDDKNLIIDKGKYLIRIKSKDIINPGNELLTDIPIENADKNIKFVVNNEDPLPGDILIQLRDNKASNKKYLYLYNPVKNKYENIDSFNADDKSIHLDRGGTYLLTEKKLHSGYFNWKVVAGAGLVCVVLGVVYIVIKRRYWFY